MVNKSDSISDKIERLSGVVDKMQVGELILPTPLFRPIGINPQTGNGWYKMFQTLQEIPLIPLFDDNDEIRAYQKVREEDLDTLAMIKKELKEIKNSIKQLKDVQE